MIVAEVSIDGAADIFDFQIALESYIVRKLAACKFAEEELALFEENLNNQNSCMLSKVLVQVMNKYKLHVS